MVQKRDCVVYSHDAGAGLPPEIAICDPVQAHRHLQPDSAILHQIGNNGGHVFVLKALRAFSGVTSLHDLSLLYLYELASGSLEEILGRMTGPTGKMGQVYAMHWKEQRIKTAANYVLFDTIGEVLALSSRVIVHSEYARKKISAIHGSMARDKIDVIPHFAPKLKAEGHSAARKELGISADELIILTSGFATRAKRFDWLIEALDALAEAGLAFRWIHAGEERVSEFDLSSEIARRPSLHGRCSVSGYVSEEMLDAYISAADIVVNLRFPSVGESSGTLARAFSAGRCCVVSDTAAYAEIPRDVVVHVPVFSTVAALVRALEGLLKSADLRESFGERASLFARTELSIDSVAARYLASVDEAGAAGRTKRPSRGKLQPVPPSVPTLRRSEFQMSQPGSNDGLADFINQKPGAFEALLWFDGPDHFARSVVEVPAFLRATVGPHVTVEGLHFVAHPDGGAFGLTVEGRSFAAAGSHR